MAFFIFCFYFHQAWACMRADWTSTFDLRRFDFGWGGLTLVDLHCIFREASCGLVTLCPLSADEYRPHLGDSCKSRGDARAPAEKVDAELGSRAERGGVGGPKPFGLARLGTPWIPRKLRVFGTRILRWYCSGTEMLRVLRV